jgi:hypothetical protein
VRALEKAELGTPAASMAFSAKTAPAVGTDQGHGGRRRADEGRMMLGGSE